MHLRFIDSRFATFLVLALALVAFGCAGGDAPTDEHADHAEHDDHADHEADAAETDSDAPRVYFSDLKDGDTVTSPLRLALTAENFTIEPVGDGMVNEGAGHYHLGINEHCLPPGTVIPPGTPGWIHFGDGSSEIEVQLEPGFTHLSLQIGDGEHRTLDEPGLCQMVNVEVIQEGV